MKTLAAFTVSILAIALPAQGQAQDAATPQITVTGEGVVSARPDMAIVNIGVTETAATARAALDKNSKSVADIIAQLKEAGIPAEDLQTSGFSIYPQYDHASRTDNGPKLIGYQVSNSLRVEINKLDMLGNILDQAVDAGFNDGGGISFSNSNLEELMDEARQAAVKNAMAKAKLMTEAAGVEVGQILSISENGNVGGTPVFMEAAKMRDAAPVPLEAGQNSYMATVTVTFALSQ